MAKLTILSIPGGTKELLLGNHAIARGAFEAGIKVASAYPGTPSSEILDTIAGAAKDAGVHAEWSVNEKTALEVAIGASYSGVRAITSMKHVGLNVALDPLVTLAYTGVDGGLVIVSADDPGLQSSQNEQDNRYLARFAKVFCIEPYDPQTCLDFTKEAFDISEKFKIPVVLRTTTRINHARGDVMCGKVPRSKGRGYFKKDPKRYVCVPSHARPLHVELNRKLKEMEEFSNESPLNKMELSGKVGIITSGVSRNYVKEAIADFELDVSLLEIGISHPAPTKLIKAFVKHCERVLVVEELEPYLEDTIKAITGPDKISGKDFVPREFELDVDRVKESIARFLEIDFKTEKREVELEIPPRPPVLCPGCSHRAVFYALEKIAKKKIYPGDIGCYTLGVLEPLEAMDTCLCMGAGISQGAGMYHAGVKDSIVAFIGDSTFLHAGIPALLNAVYNKAKMVVVILDNRTTAMTGFQPHPGTGKTATGEDAKAVDFTKIAEACGVDFIKKVKPFEVDATIEVFEEARDFDGVSVIVAEEPCALTTKKLGMWKTPPKVDEEKCKDFECEFWFPDKHGKHYERACMNLIPCPAITFEDGKSVIDESQCTGCLLCVQVCPNEAVKEEKSEK
jgi:indolepyruvate ferredoxin oxidoreductase alpha subunit